MKIYLRTPISYYGGKQQMLRHILPIIPEHETYTESFFGGGAVFWGKQPAKNEVINDLNAHVINFYKQLKTSYPKLKKLIDATIHTRDGYKEALIIYHAPYLFGELQRAWAFWVTTNMGFSRQIGTWGYDRSGKMQGYVRRRKEEFTDIYSSRLDSVQIESNDAIKVITSRDTITTFHYCDPPYVGSDQGHYGGYTQEHFDGLLNTLAGVKGKFLLSSYPNDNLAKMAKKHKWHTKKVELHLSASNKTGRKKTEVLTANYNIV
ncbi:MAG: DNA adenine methylase [Bacteroidota bacterium]